MKMNASCAVCMINRQEEAVRADENEEKKLDFLKEVMQVICAAKEKDSAPMLAEKIAAVKERYYGKDESLLKLKKEYNQIMLAYEKEIQNRIQLAENPMYTAMLYARTGNYIDFGAVREVSDQKLKELITSVEKESLDAALFETFCSQLSKAEKLVYLTDNCGEIVMDKLLILEIQKKYPQVHVDVIVRGENILNDATMADAEEVGLTKMVNVTGNGTGIAGTDLDSISQQAKQKILCADLVISKGQGNFESIHGLGLPIYYLFLCKCEWFTRRFQLKQFEGVFIHENDPKLREERYF